MWGKRADILTFLAIYIRTTERNMKTKLQKEPLML